MASLSSIGPTKEFLFSERFTALESRGSEAEELVRQVLATFRAADDLDKAIKARAPGKPGDDALTCHLAVIDRTIMAEYLELTAALLDSLKPMSSDELLARSIENARNRVSDLSATYRTEAQEHELFTTVWFGFAARDLKLLKSPNSKDKA